MVNICHCNCKLPEESEMFFYQKQTKGVRWFVLESSIYGKTVYWPHYCQINRQSTTHVFQWQYRFSMLLIDLNSDQQHLLRWGSIGSPCEPVVRFLNLGSLHPILGLAWLGKFGNFFLEGFYKGWFENFSLHPIFSFRWGLGLARPKKKKKRLLKIWGCSNFFHRRGWKSSFSNVP